jgi:molecular chaperone GrpE
LPRKKEENPESPSAVKKEMELDERDKHPQEGKKDDYEDIEIVDESAERESEEEKVASLMEENKALQEKVLRKMADLENYKKRAEKERSEAYISAKMHWAKEALPILDNFESALSSPGEGKESSFREGVQLIHRQLIELLKNMGVEEIEALGEKFNPRYHEALEIQHTDQFEKDIILEVKRKGYLLEGRLLRPSYVSVALPLNDSKKE